MIMSKFLVVVAVVLFSSIFAAASSDIVVDKLKARIQDNRNVELSMCTSSSCSDCRVAAEFKTGQCHADRRIIERGEMFFCKTEMKPRKCFRETMWRKSDKCNDEKAVIQSAPREYNQCFQDVFPIGRFSRFVKNTTHNLMQRDCDDFCINCGVEVEIPPVGVCSHLPMHARFKDITIMNSAEFTCADKGEAAAVHYFSPACDGQYNFEDSVLLDTCYNMFGRWHKFNCV